MNLRKRTHNGNPTRGGLCARARAIANESPLPPEQQEQLAKDYLEGDGYVTLIDTYFPKIRDREARGIASILVGFILKEKLDPTLRRSIDKERKSICLKNARKDGGYRHVGVLARGLIPYDGQPAETPLGNISEKQFILRMLLENRYHNLIEGRQKITYGTFEQVAELANCYFGHNRSRENLEDAFRQWKLRDVSPWPPNVEYVREKGLLKK